jgi:hypothetical protein
MLILLALAVALVAGTVAITTRGEPGVRSHAVVTPPTMSFPPSHTTTSPEYRAGRAAGRGVRRQAKPTAVLLGPAGAAALAGALTRYCRHGTAIITDGDWTCGAAPIDMDRACVFLYDDGAWAGMLNDDDPRTWRCYRDVS